MATQIPRYVVMTAAACMPASCKYGRYGKVAVVETDGERMPKQINPTHKAVRRIVEVWDRRFVGKTDQCAFRRALAEATYLAAKLNNKEH